MKRAFVLNVVFLLGSLIATTIVVWALPLGDPEPGTLPRAIGVVIFLTCYTALMTLNWYRNRYPLDETEDDA